MFDDGPDDKKANGKKKPLMLLGHELDHDWIVSRWKNGDQMKASRDRIEKCQGLRRKTTLVKLAPSWVARNPEAASWVTKVMPERRTLERDLIASVRAVEPVFSRERLGFLDRDKDYAEECENYLETWRKRNVPYPTFAIKGCEDGEYAVTCLPATVDMDGCPDFYDRLDEAAYEALDDDKRAEYRKDETDRKGRYALMDEKGNKRPSKTWDRDAKGKRPEKDAPRDDDKSREAHEEAVRNYLLHQAQGASTIRVIPAPDCVPYLTRGTKRNKWELYALIERTLYFPEEFPQSFGWSGMGDMALIPQGYQSDRTTGQEGQWYLYTAYFNVVDEKKISHPIVAYTVGGFPTWHDDQPHDDENTVAVIDLYEQYGLTGKFWGYYGGMRTGDDSPNYAWEPYIWPVYETILGIEGNATSINAANSVNCFTGYYSKPDAKLAEADPTALIDAATGDLRKTQIPAPGEIVDTVSDVYPAQQASVGDGAWRQLASETESLRFNTALDQPQGAAASGHAQVVQNTLAMVAKADIREDALDASVFCGESHLKILAAISRTYDVNWPLQTILEKPVGATTVSGGDVLEFKLDWVGNGQYRLTGSYPQEENLARVEQEASLYERGLGSFEDVQAARGKADAESEWAKVLKGRVRTHPAYVESQVTRLAKLQGNRIMQKVLSLQAQQSMTTRGVPGLPAGVPTAASRGPGGGTAAQQSRAGAISGELGTAARMADAEAQMAVGQGAAA